MTTAQLIILRNDIRVTRAATMFQGNTLLTYWNTFDFETLANYYNTLASPQVDLWRPDVTQSELAKCIVATEFQALTAVKQNTWFALLQGDILDATVALVRTNFVTIFGAGAATVTNLSAAAKKAATNFENLFTVSNVSSVYGQSVSSQDIYQSLTV